MPELPEVEVCRRGLAPELEGMQIEGVVIRAPKLRVLIPPELSSLLPGCRVSAVRRRGKYLLLDCQRAGVEGCLIIHLGMSGNLRFVPHDLAPAKHDHFELVLADQILRFADPRRFGVVVCNPGRQRRPSFTRCSHRKGSSRSPRLSRSTGFLRQIPGAAGRSSRS